MNIDTTTYNKVTLYPPTKYGPLERGYGDARGQPISIVIHTTNGSKGSSFAGEANFIYRSKLISAHYLVGKEGQVVQFLHPRIIAYHAGTVFPQYAKFGNKYSIGIENHVTVGEEWTSEQHQALYDLCRLLVQTYNITAIETHRRVASPAGRKIDPSGFPDSEFYPFVQSVLSDPSKYKVIVAIARVRSEPNTTSSVVSRAFKDQIVDVYDVVEGEKYLGNSKWCKLGDHRYIWEGLLQKL